jgi:acylphosphatase
MDQLSPGASTMRPGSFHSFRMSSDPAIRLEARVHGRVQGVGFRAFVVRQSRRLGIFGTVRNEPDGTVLVLAEAPRAVLADLLDALHDGPPGARVGRVAADWRDASGEFDGFHVSRASRW